MQNLPSGSTYGKLIKSVFQAPDNWIFCGADFNALEDRINTLLTRDPNKEKVYMGHEVYELTIGSNTHLIRDDDTINFDGKTYTGKEFYDTYYKL